MSAGRHLALLPRAEFAMPGSEWAIHSPSRDVSCILAKRNDPKTAGASDFTKAPLAPTYIPCARGPLELFSNADCLVRFDVRSFTPVKGRRPEVC